jgi:hypothetical protein
MLLRTYEAGNFEAVWNEIRSHSPRPCLMPAAALPTMFAAHPVYPR